MTLDEFDNEFDELYNNVTSNMAPGLDAYDKSVFLTNSMNAIVIKIYSGQSIGDGFENSELNRRYIANLIVRNSPSVSKQQTTYDPYLVYSSVSAMVQHPIAILAEHALISNPNCCNQKKWVKVVPVKYDELNEVMNNPFRCPNDSKVLRVDASTTNYELITKYDISSYKVEYLRRPNPIIIGDISPLTIDGLSVNSSGCELAESLHRTILEYAVQLAAASWASNNKS